MRFSRVEKLLELEVDQAYLKSNRLLFLGREDDVFVLIKNKKGSDIYEHKVIHLTKGNHQTYYFYARESFHFVQRIQDHWLFVRGRSIDENDLNASIFSNDGKLVHQFHAGDDIMGCQVDEDDDIWLAFGEEGSYSDCGLSKYGIVCLNKNGSIKKFPLYKYEGNQIPIIDDGCAINVMNDSTAWYTYWYGEDYDSIVHFTKEGDILFTGNIEIQPSHWISVQENHLFIGNRGYELSVIDLSNHRDLIQENRFDNLLDFEEIVTRDQRIVAIKNNIIYDFIP